MISGVKFVAIPVRDQDRALEFYTKKLGMRVITDSPYDDRQRWIELGIPRADTRIVLFTTSAQEPMIGGMMNVTFVAQDVEATWRSSRREASSSCASRRRPTEGRLRASRTSTATCSCSRRRDPLAALTR